MIVTVLVIGDCDYDCDGGCCPTSLVCIVGGETTSSSSSSSGSTPFLFQLFDWGTNKLLCSCL